MEFVLNTFNRMVGGEIFVLKIPGMTLMDLAEAICPECKTEIIGIRAVEKLHEVMVTRDDARNTVEFPDYYVIEPKFHFSSGASAKPETAADRWKTISNTIPGIIQQFSFWPY